MVICDPPREKGRKLQIYAIIKIKFNWRHK